MQRGFYGFEHSYLSRAGNKQRGKSGPLHLSAVASYMSNTRKVGNVMAVNLPTARGELYRELNKHTNSVTRKNGRIAETFLVSFDVRMTPEHQDEALGRFLMAVTFQGKTRAEAWRHVDHDHNPHAHVLLIDVDENGEQVAHFGRSGSWRRENSPVKGNPTTWLRQAWEDECNAVLEAHGYDFRVDRRSKLEQGLAKQHGEDLARQEAIPETEEKPDIAIPISEEKQDVEQLSGETAVLGATPECPPMPVDALPEADTVDDLSEPEEAMAEDAVRRKVGFATDMYNQLQFLRKTQSRLDYVTRQLASAVQGLQEAEAAAPEYTKAMHDAEQKAEQAKQNLAQYQRANGKLKGFDLLIWKSPTRKRGEEAALDFHSLELTHTNAKKDYEAAQGKVEYYKSLITSHTEQKHRAQDDLTQIEKTLGNVQDLGEAEEIMTYNIAQSLKGVEAGQLKQMVQDGEISEGEYVDALTIINTPSAQLALEEMKEEQQPEF